MEKLIPPAGVSILGLIFGLSLLPALSGAEDIPYAADAGWQGERVCEILTEDDQIRVMRCTLAAGGGHERHYHLPNIVYVLEGGELRISQEGETRDVTPRAGEVYVSDQQQVHEALNLSNHDQSYVIIEKKY